MAISFPVSPEKQTQLAARMAKLQIKESDNKFINIFMSYFIFEEGQMSFKGQPSHSVL